MSSSSSSIREFEDQLRHARYISDFLHDRKMTSSTSTATPMKHAFTQHVEQLQTPKSNINAIILDYLTVAGYPNAAAKFSTEANLQPQQSTPAIRARQQIQHSIHKGDIQEAIYALNDLDSSMLEEDEPLHFALLRLQLVELIRACNSSPGRDITPALTFAQSHLGPRAAKHPEFLEDLEKTMSLLVFEPNDSMDPSLTALLQPSLRREVADKVNKAILDRQQLRNSTAIVQLVQTRAWAEDVTRKETKKDLPARIELGLEESDKQDHNGHEPMITT